MTQLLDASFTMQASTPLSSDFDGSKTDASAFSPAMPAYAASGWQRVIDRTLIEWGRDPSVLADDGVTPPSKQAIQVAIAIAEAVRGMGISPPDRVVPDGDGGIVFEQRSGPISRTIEIHDNGDVYVSQFRDSRLVRRERLEDMRG